MRWMVVIVLLFASVGCDSDNMQEDFEDAALRPPAGFTRTDATGEVLSEDEDDWRTAPRYLGLVRVSPAYPNPPGDVVVYIPVSVFSSVRGGLVLRAVGEERLLVLDEIREANTSGAYLFTFTPALIGRSGLVRLLIYDGFGDLVSYGDLMIE